MADDTVFAPGQSIDWQDSVVGMVRYGGGDKSMVVMFYTKPVHQPGESAAKGRQVFKDEVFVRIHPPGERLNIIDRPATSADAQRFPIQWAQFKQNAVQIPDGTPIEQLYPDKPSVAATLRAYGVHTIEMCAELSAHAIDNVGMGAQSYVNDARKYIEVSSRGVSTIEFRRELEDRDRKIARYEQNIATLQGQVDQLLADRVGGPSTEQLQQLIAQVMQRPVLAPGVRADPQMAMINANHKTVDLSKPAKRASKDKEEMAPTPVRKRGKSR
jgi:hypothetical protein